MSEESHHRWTAADPESLLWEQFGDEYIVYQISSGKTHYLNGAGATILQFLSDREASTEEVVEAVCRHTEAAIDEALADQIEKSLAHFDQLGLVITA